MADDRRSNQMLERIDTDTLGGMPAETGLFRANFLPASFSEAMELAKLMAAGTFVAERLRGKPGDCLAIVMLATRLRMDPFVVAQKVYFVNNQGIPGYEAQLVNAILNTSGHLDGRLFVEWEGEGEALVCTVSGKVKGDPRERTLRQPIKTITTRNSPLWKQAPMIQLAYHAQRSWARLYAPEALLGIYAADELVEDDASQRRIETRPAAPTRAAVATRVTAEPVGERTETIVDRGEVVDSNTGEVVGRTEEDEETARRLDAEAAAAERGDVDEVLDQQVSEEIDDTIPHQQAKPAEEAKPEPVAETPAAVAAPAIDWESWLTKFDKDLDKLTGIDAVNQLYASKTTKLAEAPDGVKNRARGYHAARLRKLDKPADAAPATKRNTAASRTAAAAAAVEEAKPADPAVAETVLDVTARADQMIAYFNSKEMLIDLRTAKAALDEEIDQMPEEEAGRVNRAFRAVEDKLRGGKK